MFLLLEAFFFFFELRYFLVNLKQIIKIYKRLYSYKYIKISFVDLTILLAINKKFMDKIFATNYKDKSIYYFLFVPKVRWRVKINKNTYTYILKKRKIKLYK